MSRRRSWLQLITVLVFIALLVGVYFGYQQYTDWRSIKAKEESTVLLEKMRTVAKLITVEGQFSEIISYKDYWAWDWFPFRKKALIRVQATVSVGYDLSKVTFRAYPEQKRMVIEQLPAPEILSLEHDLDYYDLSEGTFNTFLKEDYNRINAEAKAKIREQAENSELFSAAQDQAAKMLDLMAFMVESTGWTFDYDPVKIKEKPFSKEFDLLE